MWLPGQAVPAPDVGWGQYLQAFGAFAAAAAILLTACWVLWKENQALRAELARKDAAVLAMAERILPLQGESVRVLGEAIKVMDDRRGGASAAQERLIQGMHDAVLDLRAEVDRTRRGNQ